jgi:UDP-3-O-[3-hydroxymyristoyl] glucosamine N-acyltransferase
MIPRELSCAGDSRFFLKTGPHHLAAVAKVAEGEAADCDLRLTGVAPLQLARPDHVSFLDNRKYADALAATRAGAVIVHPDMAHRVPSHSVAIITPTPYRAWAHVAAMFHPEPPVTPGTHPSAVIESDAVCDPSAEIGPFVHIGAGATIGPRCRIAAHAVIGAGVMMGADCRIGSHASVSHAILGDRVYIYPGARIGQEGFGFDPTPTERGFLGVPQLGRVILESDVEIGANSAVDRGSTQDTVIGQGSRLDNLVQIGHNVRLGRCCVIVAQAGISGSTVLEDFVTVAAQAGLAGHLLIRRKARVGAKAGVMADIEEGMDVLGSPAQPVRQFFREVAVLRKIVRERSTPRKDEGTD